MTGDVFPRQHGWKILIVGTGGQGVLTAANLLIEFFVQKGHQVTSGQLHGMAQRGGSVQSSVMVDCGINPAVPEGGADVVVGLEPVEAARALPFISSQTAVFMNTAPVIPFTLDQQVARGDELARYPDVNELADLIRSTAKEVLTLDATRLAQQAGSIQATNMVMLGCWLGSDFSPYEPQEFIDTVLSGLVTASTDLNREAFTRGVEAGKKLPGAG